MGKIKKQMHMARKYNNHKIIAYLWKHEEGAQEVGLNYISHILISYYR